MEEDSYTKFLEQINETNRRVAKLQRIALEMHFAYIARTTGKRYRVPSVPVYTIDLATRRPRMDNMPLGGYTMIVHQGQPHLNEIYAAGPIHPLLRREFERDLRELKQARAAYNKHRHLT